MTNIYHTVQNKRRENQLYVQNSFSRSIKKRKSNFMVLEGKWVVSGRWLSFQVGENMGEEVRRKGGYWPYSLGE